MAATCKKCGAPIVWIKTEPPRVKWMPCDEGLKRYRANPNGKGKVITDRGQVVSCDLLEDDDHSIPTGLARISHFATCPYAEDFRRLT